jgi:hypothetical protein
MLELWEDITHSSNLNKELRTKIDHYLNEFETTHLTPVYLDFGEFINNIETQKQFLIEALASKSINATRLVFAACSSHTEMIWQLLSEEIKDLFEEVAFIDNKRKGEISGYTILHPNQIKPKPEDYCLILSISEHAQEYKVMFADAVGCENIAQLKLQAMSKAKDLRRTAPPVLSRPKIKKVIAIQCWARSGSTLLHSILDDHPSMIGLPFLFGRNLIALWESLEGDIKNNWNKFLIFALDELKWSPQYEHWGLLTMGKNQDESLRGDPAIFLWCFIKHYRESFNLQDFIITYFTAFNDAIGHDCHNAEFLVFPLHALPQETGNKLADAFESIDFVYTYRDHKSLYSSHFSAGFNSINLSLASDNRPNKHSRVSYSMYLTLNGILEMLANCVEMVSDTQQMGKFYYPKEQNPTRRSYALLFEDICMFPNATLSSLCKKLAIPWHDNLLKVTFGGRDWFNRTDSARQTGFSNNSKKLNNTYLSLFDAWRIDSLFCGERARFVYEHENWRRFHRRLLLPLAMTFPFKVELSQAHITLGIKMGEPSPRVIVQLLNNDIQEYFTARLLMSRIWWREITGTAKETVPVLKHDWHNKKGNFRPGLLLLVKWESAQQKELMIKALDSSNFNQLTTTICLFDTIVSDEVTKANAYELIDHHINSGRNVIISSTSLTDETLAWCKIHIDRYLELKIKPGSIFSAQETIEEHWVKPRRKVITFANSKHVRLLRKQIYSYLD